MVEKKKLNFIEIEADKTIFNNLDVIVGRKVVNNEGETVGEITLSYEDDKLTVKGKVEF